MAYAAGNPRIPEECIGCSYSLSYQSLVCEFCKHNPTPDPDYELERIWGDIINAATDGYCKARYRREHNIPVDSPDYQEMNKGPMSILLDKHDKLLDATNSAVAVPVSEEQR
jgi:hypothetical protein